MSKVNNFCPLEKLIHQTFHDLAEEYGIDVDIIAEIINKYSDILSENIEQKIVINPN